MIIRRLNINGNKRQHGDKTLTGKMIIEKRQNINGDKRQQGDKTMT